MSNARNLANLLGTDTQIQTADIADDAVTIGKLNDNATQLFGFRNRIINGDMRIDQRNAGALVAGATGNIFAVDRFPTGVFGSGTGRISAQQSNVVPTNAGFLKSVINTVTTADAAPSEYFGYVFQHKIEGFNIADLEWGTASAKAVTLSFWVRNSLTGTYIVTLCNENNDRTYSATYTISAANTWEQKTITVPGDTTGTWYTTTNAGIQVFWGLGGGSGRQAPSTNAWNTGPGGGYAVTDAPGCVDWIATSGATFYITGVQLEAGSVATPFERRPFGTELALCQRYYQKSYNILDVPGTATNAGIYMARAYNTDPYFIDLMHPLRVSMRSMPTVVGYSPTTGAVNRVRQFASDLTISAISEIGENTTGYPFLSGTVTAGGDTRWHWTASAEL
jgi:hypothetical protein